MKVLLIGEYSGVHTTIAKKLRLLGEYDVTVIHDGDGYKDFQPDIIIKKNSKVFKSKLLKKIYSIYILITSFLGVNGFFEIFKYTKSIKNLKDYDVVQLINPFFLSGFGAWVNLYVFFYLKKNNKKIILLAVGDDTAWAKACLTNKIKYSFFDRMNFKNFYKFLPSLFHFYSPAYVLLNKVVVSKSDKIVAGAYDYYLAYNDAINKAYVPLSIEVEETISPYKFQGYPISIFHGWQPGRDLKKGNDVFHEAILRLEKNYPDKVKYDIVSNVTYKEYIKSFNDSVIFIDQCFSLDKGINALLGMSNGKVVLSGNDDGVVEFIPEIKGCLIDALPDKDSIYRMLESLINDPVLLEEYSIKANEFVFNFHNIDKNIYSFIKIWKA